MGAREEGHSCLPGKPGSRLVLLCLFFFFVLSTFIHLKIIVGNIGLFGVV